MKNTNNEQPRDVIEVPGLVTYPVGDETISAISMVDVVGSTLTRTCPSFEEIKSRYITEGLTPTEAVKMATTYCLGECASRDLTVSQNREKGNLCPEKNTLDALTCLGIQPEQTMIVAVTGNNVGFSDEFDMYVANGSASTNPEGWRQVNGCNAFFSDAEDCPVLACRLADCGDLNIEFKTQDGRTIIGFMHLTRPNQYGTTACPDSQDGLPYVEYALRKAIEHYGDVDISTMSLTLRSAIEKQDFLFSFTDSEKMQQVLPGWAQDGYVENLDNPYWKPGDSFEPTDHFTADFRGVVEDSINLSMQRLGITEDQYDNSNMIDTMHDPHFASDQEDKKLGIPARRDLYITAHKSALAKN
ncbi:MAG: hypothetical protein WCP03_00200 [Candidatus Saccharibacteria bacterium]